MTCRLLQDAVLEIQAATRAVESVLCIQAQQFRADPFGQEREGGFQRGGRLIRGLEKQAEVARTLACPIKEGVTEESFAGQGAGRFKTFRDTMFDEDGLAEVDQGAGCAGQGERFGAALLAGGNDRDPGGWKVQGTRNEYPVCAQFAGNPGNQGIQKRVTGQVQGTLDQRTQGGAAARGRCAHGKNLMKSICDY